MYQVNSNALLVAKFTFLLDWINDQLYPITNYTNMIEKILSVFPKSQLLVVNGDNLIRFVLQSSL